MKITTQIVCMNHLAHNSRGYGLKNLDVQTSAL